MSLSGTGCAGTRTAPFGRPGERRAAEPAVWCDAGAPPTIGAGGGHAGLVAGAGPVRRTGAGSPPPRRRPGMRSPSEDDAR